MPRILRRLTAGLLAPALAAGALALDLPTSGAEATRPSAAADDGALLDAVYQNVSGSPTVPSTSAAVASEGEDTYVAWREGERIAFRAVREHGFLQDPQPVVFDVGSGRPGSDEPSVAAVGDDVFVAWSQGMPDPDNPSVFVWEVHVATSHDRGRTFDAPQQWSERGGESAYGPKLAASDRVVAVTWEGAAREIVLAARHRGGGSVELDSVGTAFNGEYQVAVEGEVVHVVWIEDAVYAARKLEMGKGLESRRMVGGKDHQPHHPDLVVDGDDVAVGWIEYAGNRAFDPVFVGESADGGASWRPRAVSGRTESCGEKCGGPGPQVGLANGRVHAFYGGGAAGVYEAIVDDGKLLSIAHVGGSPTVGTVTDALVTDRGVHVAWTAWDPVGFRSRVLDGTRRHGSDDWSIRTDDLGGIAWEPRLAALDGDFTATWNEFSRVTKDSEVVVRPGSMGGRDLVVLSAEAVQAARGATQLVTGKPTAYRARVRNDFARAQDVTVAWRIYNADREEHVEEQEVTLRPGVQTLTYVPEHWDLQSGAVEVEVEIDHLDAVEESDEDNNDASSPTYDAVPTRAHHVLYVPLQDPTTGEAATCRDAELLAATSQPYIEAVWPADPAESAAAVACADPIEYHGGQLKDTAQVVAHARRQLRSAFAAAWDQVVVVTPPGWIAANLYDAEADTRGTSIIAGGTGIVLADATAHGGPIVVHELSHDLRWVDPDPDATPEQKHLHDVDAPGFWVERGQDVLGRFDYMRQKVASATDGVHYWISNGTWEHLLAAQAGADPTDAALRTAAPAGVLSVDGLVTADGSVEAPAWRLVDAPPTVALGGEGDGELEVRLRDRTGTTVGRSRLALSVVGDGDATKSRNRAFAGFVPLPDGTATVELLLDGDVVLRRRASDAVPSIELAPMDDVTTAPGAPLELSWTTFDADGDDLTVDVELSTNDGATWLPAAAALTGATTTVTLPSQAFDAVLVRATVSDGWHTATATSDPIVVAGGLRNGRIAFGRGDKEANDQTALTDLFTMAPDGTDARPLVGRDVIPVEYGDSIRTAEWAPDGHRLAFATDHGPELYVVDEDGRSLRALGLGAVFTPSPDGGRTAVHCPTWSPDGRRLVFLEQGTGPHGQLPRGSRIWTVAVDEPGAQPELLVGEALRPYACSLDWRATPDGERIYVLGRDGGLDSYRPDGTAKRRELDRAPGTPLYGADVSPDGTEVAFFGQTTSGPSQLWLGDLEDGTFRQLTALGPAEGAVTRARWAPDGRRLVVDLHIPQPRQPIRRLALVDAFTGAHQVLAAPELLSDREATWQPVRSVPPEVGEPLPRVDARIMAPSSVVEGAPVALDATGSVVDEGPATYAWDLHGDGTFTDATGPTASVTPIDDGTRTIGLEVTDRLGQASVTTMAVTVTEAPPILSGATARRSTRSTTVEATVRTAQGETLSGEVRWSDGTTTEAVLAAGPDGAWTLTAVRSGAVPGGSATVVVTDDDGSTARADVAITAAPANQPPTASGASVTTTKGVPVEIGLGATDPDGPVTDLQARVVKAPAKGSVWGGRGGLAGPVLRYVPAKGFTGTETFTVDVFDGQAASKPVTVTVTTTGPCATQRTLLGTLVCAVVTIVRSVLQLLR